MNNTLTKSFLITASVILFMLSACNSSGDKAKRIQKSHTVKPFKHILIEGVFPVVLTHEAGRNVVDVVAASTMQNAVDIQNAGDTLRINTVSSNSLNGKPDVKVRVYIDTLYSIHYSGIGNLKSSNAIVADSLHIESESVGKLELEINADFLRANLKSVGANILKGKVREARVNNKSVGALNTYQMKTDIMMINNASIGLAEVAAEKEFHIRSNAIGNLYYKGPAEVKELKVEGIGKVEKK